MTEPVQGFLYSIEQQGVEHPVSYLWATPFCLPKNSTIPLKIQDVLNQCRFFCTENSRCLEVKLPTKSAQNLNRVYSIRSNGKECWITDILLIQALLEAKKPYSAITCMNTNGNPPWKEVYHKEMVEASIQSDFPHLQGLWRRRQETLRKKIEQCEQETNNKSDESLQKLKKCRGLLRERIEKDNKKLASEIADLLTKIKKSFFLSVDVNRLGYDPQIPSNLVVCLKEHHFQVKPLFKSIE